MTQDGFTVEIVAVATATHPPGTIVHPDGSLTPPPDVSGPDGGDEQVTDDELDDDEGTVTP
jgi:hypothetical protein